MTDRNHEPVVPPRHKPTEREKLQGLLTSKRDSDPGDMFNFDQHVQDGNDLGAYDYGSIMHYPSHAFSTNGQPTIVPKNGVPIGQRTALSRGDFAAVREIYSAFYA